MRQAIFIAFALSAIFAVNAQYDYEAASFTEAPLQVLTAKTDSTLFQIPFVSRFINDTYIPLWGFYGDSDTAPITYNAVRRLFNGTDLTVVGNDSNIALNLTYESQPLLASSTDGFVAVAGVVSNTTTTTTTTNDSNTTNSTNTTTTTVSVQVTVFSSDTDESNETETVTIDSTTNSSVSYTIYQLWFEDNYFYVLYAVSLSGVESNLLLQGFKRNGGSLQYSTSQQINTNNLTGNVQAQAAQQDDDIVISWRYDTQGQVVVNTITTGGSLGTETTIATDSGNGNTFAPAAVVYAQDYYVVVLSQTTTAGLTTGFSVSYAGSNVTTTLGFALDSGYNTYSISAASPYYDGWFVITRQSKVDGDTVTATEETIQIYNYTQTITTVVSSNSTDNTTNSTNSTNGSNDTNATTTVTTTSTDPIQETLITDGSIIQGFTLQNQSYYVFILDSETGETGAWTAGYLGQVFSAISFGSAIKSALAIVSAVVALLFVF